MSKVFHVSNYKTVFSDIFLFDNNVWMFLFCPIGNYSKDKKQRFYSAFFTELVTSKRTIIIHSLILSEFSNAYLRLEYDIWKNKPENAGKTSYKKDFVGSKRFHETVEEIKINIKKILKVTEKFSDDFNTINIDNLFLNFGDTDFNDSYYIELARIKKYKIVSDDADFFKKNYSGIEIITANISL